MVVFIYYGFYPTHMRYYPNPEFKKKTQITFSSIEITHLFWAWLGISVAFANILSYGNYFQSFLISAIAVGLGFLVHELCHKIVAQRFGLAAEFRASYFMLWLAVLISFLGFVFAAPGAVMINGRPTKKQNGLISIAGPISNIVLALLFSLLFFSASNQFLQIMFRYGVIINVWLALFNMLPFWLLDGKKVIQWDKTVYYVTMGVIFGMFMLTNFI
jgi:Zn-dependent protease